MDPLIAKMINDRFDRLEDKVDEKFDKVDAKIDSINEYKWINVGKMNVVTFLASIVCSFLISKLWWK